MKRMDLKSRRTLLSIGLALVLCLCLTACGSPAGPAEAEADDELLVSDMASLDGVWSSDDGLSVLYFDSADGCYLYHSPYGSTGRGVFSNESGKPMIDFCGFLYDFYLNDDGVLQLNRNGSDSGKTPDLSGEKFRRDEEAQISEWQLADLDGTWQNEAGETIAIDAANREYSACSPDYASSGTIGDDEDGRGPYLFDNGNRAYLCPAADSDSFVITNGLGTRYSEDGHFDGTFYRCEDAMDRFGN